ncbi:hypothetical protein ASD44_09675 [Mesorhizobium sp. Root554]|nr:hypothetical protein ASD27_09685 [Mesorhizobium sp. Root1471]KQZ36822.1 hypothetical protein ASD44_09675 [Mesorhizobium sp. Root554]
MGRAAIIREMRPKGVVRDVIQALADENGAYIIVSSHGSTADTALRDRRDAMRSALAGAKNSDQLIVDFYDRTRLATWVRRHAGLSIFVKEKIGRAQTGWRPYGPWAGPADQPESEYLLDDKLRLQFKSRDVSSTSIADGIDLLRDELAQSARMVRLIGLSGVGKTRLVQALFDARVGSRPLAPSLAVYTNMNDDPDPQPIGLASDLIANRTRAILIVDNCTPELHGRLSELCSASDSQVSVLTVEYDVRDDQKEGTQVVSLDTSSPELIEKLITRRFPTISGVDARTIAEAAGGNARIAIALASTIGQTETVAGLSDEELFQRLFKQRNDPDGALLRAAHVCSLLYSFQGEDTHGSEAELPRLALLAEQSGQELYRHVGELYRRDMVQKRGAWRAVLPHAIASRLAAHALENIPYSLIDQQLVSGGTDRTARSFSRRLAFLPAHPTAVSIATKWFAEGGLLGDPASLSETGAAMFANAASILPDKALDVLERVSDPGIATLVYRRSTFLLRSLAYDPALFERASGLLIHAAINASEEHVAKDVSDVFVSLFPVYLSGTQATIEQRLKVIEKLLRSDNRKRIELGLAALEEVLKASHFSSVYQFDFGSRSRDYGYQPKSSSELRRWFSAGLSLVDTLAVRQGILKQELQSLVARCFRDLWSVAKMFNELECLSRTFSSWGFWREGWASCRQTLRFDRTQLSPTGRSRLIALEAELRPNDLASRIRAIVLGERLDSLDALDAVAEGNFDDDVVGQLSRIENTARELGQEVASDDALLSELIPDLLRGGSRVFSFGRGLAEATGARRETWAKLVAPIRQTPPGTFSLVVLKGYLSALWETDPQVAQDLLDEVAQNHEQMAQFLPFLQSALPIDDKGLIRLKRLLDSDIVPVEQFRFLAVGGSASSLEASDLRDLLRLILSKHGGFEVALEILSMRFYSLASEKAPNEPDLIEAGRELLQNIVFRKGGQSDDFHLATVASNCLLGPEAVSTAASVATQLRQAVAEHKTYAFDNDDLLKAALRAQPIAILDALFDGDEQQVRSGIEVFNHLDNYRPNPMDVVSSDILLTWCNADPGMRFAPAAWVVTYKYSASSREPLVWSQQARLLLEYAPDPVAVMKVFVARFRPTSWSGSFAAILEENARLLDNLEGPTPEELVLYIREAKKRLQQDIAIARQTETEWDRERDERFE